MTSKSNGQSGGEFHDDVHIAAGSVTLEGELRIPPHAPGVVLFAHGSGSSRHSPRNQFVAATLREAGLATLLFDLLTREEEIRESRTRHLRFDIQLLAQRLVQASHWIGQQPGCQHLGLGYFGASTGGGAALVAAAELGPGVAAVVSRGGRPDLAGDALSRVASPTLLLVGERDEYVLQLNEDAWARLKCEKALKEIEGATHLFEERGALEEVARLAAEWFCQHLRAR